MTYFADVAAKLGYELGEADKRIAETALLEGAAVEVAAGRIRTHRRVELFGQLVKDIADDLDPPDIAAARARVESGSSADDVSNELHSKLKASSSAAAAHLDGDSQTATAVAPNSGIKRS